MPNTRPNVITVQCENCEQRHQGEYSHDSQFGGHAVYEVTCPEDLLVDFYTEAADVS